jgi:hypothetical protein
LRSFSFVFIHFWGLIGTVLATSAPILLSNLMHIHFFYRKFYRKSLRRLKRPLLPSCGFSQKNVDRVAFHPNVERNSHGSIDVHAMMEATAYTCRRRCARTRSSPMPSSVESRQDRQKTGIENRHLVGRTKTALDLAEQACRRLFARVPADGIDYMSFAPEPGLLSAVHGLPAGSSAWVCPPLSARSISTWALRVHRRAGAGRGAHLRRHGAAGAAGYGETYTRHIHPQDLANRTIFGDAATAGIISAAQGMTSARSPLHRRLRRAKPHCAQRRPAAPLRRQAPDIEDESGNIHTHNHLYMNGRRSSTSPSRPCRSW